MAVNLLHANDKSGEYPATWYAATVEFPAARPMLEGSHAADVCIIGAGYTGLSAALHLAQAGKSVIILDAHRAGWGASGRNGGQAGSGQRRGQDELEKALGHSQAALLWDLGEEAKALVRSLADTHGIACDIVPGIIHADHKPQFVQHSRAYVQLLNSRYGYEKIRFLDRDEMRSLVASPNYFGGTYDEGAFHLNPLKYVLGLSRAAQAAGARLHEMSEVVKIERGVEAVVRTAHGEVRCGHVLLACNGYLGMLEPGTAANVMPINNFIVASEPLGSEAAAKLIANNAAVADSRFVINYFRLTPDHRLLFGGGETYGYRFPADIKAFVRKPMLKVFPQLAKARLEFGWGGTLAITGKRLPALRRVEPNILSASGYSGQGITIATLCGKLAAEAICGNAERFEIYGSISSMPFPGGGLLRSPLLALAMSWYAVRDRI
jgi:gamma-glutamylputrescine oxidase